MGFDRSKYKATTMAALKEQQQQQEAMRPASQDRSYLKIEAGDNKFRIMPFHPDGGGKSYAEAKTVSFLTVTGPKRDDSGKPIEGETEIKRRPIFHAKVHGGYPYDLVDAYLEVAKKEAIPAWLEASGNRGSDSKFKTIWNKLTGQEGIRPQDTWQVYAMKSTGRDESGNLMWGPIGILELKKKMKDQMQEIAAQFSDGIQSPDPFSDPEDGIPINIHKSGKGLDTEYKVTLESTTVRDKGKVSTEYVLAPLTDEQLEALDKLEPLYKLYRNVYKHSDLESQLEGLERMDAQLKADGYDINVFGYASFLNIVNTMLDLVPEDAQEEEKETKKPAPKKPAAKTAPAPKPKPAPEPEPEEEEEEEQEEEAHEEEEVKEEVRKPAPITRKAPPEVKQPAHVAAVDNKLAEIRAKLGKK